MFWLVVDVQDSICHKICEFYNCRQTCGLQCGVAVFSGKVYNAGYGSIANLRQLFLDADTGQKGAVSECNISNMLPYAEGGIDSDNERLIKSIFNLRDNGRKVYGMDRRLQGAVYNRHGGGRFADGKSVHQLFTHDRAETVARCPVRPYT